MVLLEPMSLSHLADLTPSLLCDVPTSLSSDQGRLHVSVLRPTSVVRTQASPLFLLEADTEITQFAAATLRSPLSEAQRNPGAPPPQRTTSANGDPGQQAANLSLRPLLFESCATITAVTVITRGGDYHPDRANRRVWGPR